MYCRPRVTGSHKVRYESARESATSAATVPPIIAPASPISRTPTASARKATASVTSATRAARFASLRGSAALCIDPRMRRTGKPAAESSRATSDSSRRR